MRVRMKPCRISNNSRNTFINHSPTMTMSPSCGPNSPPQRMSHLTTINLPINNDVVVIIVIVVVPNQGLPLLLLPPPLPLPSVSPPLLLPPSFPAVSLVVVVVVLFARPLTFQPRRHLSRVVYPTADNSSDMLVNLGLVQTLLAGVLLPHCGGKQCNYEGRQGPLQ